MDRGVGVDPVLLIAFCVYCHRKSLNGAFYPKRQVYTLSQLKLLTQPSFKKRQIVSIQVCRGLAALIVVWSHMFNVGIRYFHTNLLAVFQIGHLGVDLFFVISGVVITMVTAGKFASPRDAIAFLYHRMARIYPIYWFYSAIVLAAYLYNPLLVNASSGHHADLLRSFLLIPSRIEFLVQQAWTLSHEIWFYIVFFLLMVAVRERFVPIFLALWCAVLIALFGFRPEPGILRLLSNPISLEFIAGYVLFQIYNRGGLHPRAGKILIAASLVWLTALLFWSGHAHEFGTMWIEDSAWKQVALYGPFAFMFLLGAMELERSSGARVALPFKVLGDWSYSIYLSHMIAIGLLVRLLACLPAYVPLAFPLFLILSMPVVIAVGGLSYTWIEMPMMKFLYKRAPQSAISAPQAV
jgi:peptidoglycan/LPS O-acetylase OafA/YrhL